MPQNTEKRTFNHANSDSEKDSPKGNRFDAKNGFARDVPT